MLVHSGFWLGARVIGSSKLVAHTRGGKESANILMANTTVVTDAHGDYCGRLQTWCFELLMEDPYL